MNKSNKIPRGKMPLLLPGIESGDKLLTMAPESRGVGKNFGFDRLFTKEISHTAVALRGYERHLRRATSFQRAGAYETPKLARGRALAYETPEYHAINGSRFVNGLSCFSLGEWNPSYREIHRSIRSGLVAVGKIVVGINLVPTERTHASLPRIGAQIRRQEPKI